MGGKTKIKGTSNNAVIAHSKRALSDGTEFEVAIYSPVLRDGKYYSKFRLVINGVAEEESVDADTGIDALSLATFFPRYELNVKGVVGDREQSTGLEFWHDDPDMNALFRSMCELESSIGLIYRETVSRGQYHGKNPNCAEIGPDTIAGMDFSDELVERWSMVAQLRQIIRIRVIEMGIQRRFEGKLFALGRVPKVRRLAKARNTCPPVATTTRLVKETKNNAHISVWPPIQDGDMLWRCEYQIDGLESRIVAETEGVDSMEALTSVFDAIADDLDNSSYSVAYPGENGEWYDCPFGEVFHGFEREVDPEMNTLQTHLFTAEVLRNTILYKSAAGEEHVAELETTMLSHLAEAERIRLQIDRRLCGGGPLRVERDEGD